MADFKRIVEILVQVTGDTGRQIENVANNLKKIETAVSAVNSSATSAVKSIESLTGALSKLKDFQAPQLDQFARDIRTLSTVDAGKLSAIAVSLDSLSKVKFDSGIGNFFSKLSELGKVGDPAKVAALADSLAKFGSIGKLPSLTSFTNNLKELATVTKLPSLQGFANQLSQISAVTSLPAIGAFVNNLQKVSQLGAIPDLNPLAKALQVFQSIGKLPDLVPFSSGLAAISAVSKPESFAALATSLKKLQEVDVSKMPKATELMLLARAVSSFSAIGNIPSITKFVNALKQLQNIGSISIPNFSQLITEVNRLSAAFNNMANVAPIISSLAAMGVQAQRLQQQLNSVSQTAQGSTTIFAKFGKQIKDYFMYRIIADNMLNLKEAIFSAQDAIIDFDQSLKDLQAISGATDLEVLGMGQTIKQVAASTKFSASEVAEGMIILAQAGFSAVDASRTMEAVANLATGTLESMAQTVDLISTAMTIFNIEASRSADVADMLANAINKSKLTVEKLRTAINYVGPVAEDAGISMEEMSAAMMTLANSGLRASTIGTSLRTIIGELIDPSKKMQDAVRAAGMSLSELDPRVTSLGTVIGNLKNVITDSQDALDIFGKRASSAVLTLANTTTGGYEEMLAAVTKSGTAAAMAAKQMEGLGVAFKNLRDKLSLLAISMGEGGIVQAMRLFVDMARSAVDALLKLSDSGFGKFAMQVASASAAILGVIGIVKGLVNAFTVARASSAAASTSLGIVASSANVAAVSVTRLNTVLKAGVAGLVITAVAAAIEVFTNKAQKASDDTGVLIGQLESLASASTSYTNKISEAGGNLNKTTEANKQLRGELENVAKNSEKFGATLSQAALEAMQSIDGLNFEVRDGGKAIQEYQAAIDALKDSKLRDHFKQQEEAVKESVSFTTRMANRVNTIIASIGSTDEDGSIFSGMADGQAQALEYMQRQRDTDARLFTANLLEKKNEWDSYVEYIKKVSDNLDKTVDEKKAIDVYNKYVEMASSSLIRLKEKGSDVTNSTIGELMNLASSYGYVQEEGTASYTALQRQLESLAKKNAETSRGMVDNWKQDSTVLSTSLKGAIASIGDTSNELKSSLQDTLSVIDLGVLEELSAKRAEIVAKQDALDSQYAIGKKAKDKNYYLQWNALQKEASQLNSKYLNDESVNRQVAMKDAIGAYKKSLADINKVYANNAEMRAKEEARIEIELVGKLAKIRSGATASPEAMENRVKNARSVVEASGAAELQALAELEAEKKISEDEYAKYRVESEYKTLAEKLKLSTDHFSQIKGLVSSDSDEWKKANTQKLEDEKAVADFIRKELVDAFKKASKAQEELTKLYGTNKLGGQVGAEIDKHSANVGLEYEKNRKTIEDIHRKSTEKIADIEDKLTKKIDKANEDREKDAKESTASITDIHRKAADQIAGINQRGMSDSRKNSDNKKRINEKLYQAEQDMAKAKLNNDAAALKSAESLYSQVFSMADGLKSKSDAISKTRLAEKGLVDVEKTKQAIAEFERGKKLAEDIAEAEKERAKVVSDDRREVGDQATKYQEIERHETARHEKEMADLNLEISQWEKKLAIARETISMTQQVASTDPNRATVDATKANIVVPDTKTGTNTSQDIAVATEQFSKLKSMVETGAVLKIDGAGAVTTLQDVQRALPAEIKSTVALDTAQVQTAVQDLTRALSITPVQVPVSIDSTPLQDIQNTITSMQEVGINLSVLVDNADVLATILGQLEEIEKQKSKEINIEVTGADTVVSLKTILDAIVSKTISVVAEVSGLEQLNQLKAAIDAIQSKTVVITTRYDTVGVPPTQGMATGGPITSLFKRMTGNRLITKGSGTKDDVPIMAMKDEYVHKQAAVRKYGVGFMNAVNNLQFPMDLARGFASGGLVQAFASGGRVLSSAKRKIEDYLGENISIDSVNITNKVSEAASSIIHPIGKDAILSMMGGIKDVVSKFASGGPTNTSVMSASDLDKIRREYDSQIQIASSTGHSSVAAILVKEKEELLKLAATLRANLKAIEEEYKRKMAAGNAAALSEEEQLDLSYNEQKKADERSYAEKVASDDLQFAREDFDYQKQQASKLDSFKKSLEDLKNELPKQLEDYQSDLQDAQKEYDDAKKKLINFRTSKASSFYSAATLEKDLSIPMESILKQYYTPIEFTPGNGLFGNRTKIHTGSPDMNSVKTTLDKYNEEILRPFNEAKSALEELKNSEPNLELSKSIQELTDAFNLDKSESDMARTRSMSDREFSIFDRDRSYKESRMNAGLEYKKAKDELKAKAHSDSESLSIDKENAMAKARTANLDAIDFIKSKAAKEVTGAKNRMQFSIAELTGNKNKYANTSTESEVPDVANKISSSKFGVSIDELLKRVSKGILRFNSGGAVPFMKGAVHGKDSILAALTPNEYVIKAGAVRAFGVPFFDMINNLSIPKFNSGGLVSSVDTSGISSKVVHAIDLTFNGSTVGEFTGSPVSIDNFIDALNTAKLRV